MINSKYRTVSVVGLGYIGLPTAAVLASSGLTVLGVDINEAIVNEINAGKTHIVEPDLDELVKKVVQSKTLQASTVPSMSDVFIIAVPTPINDNKKPEMRYVDSAINSIAPALKTGDLIIIESTSPVGTTEQVSKTLANLRADLVFPTRNGDVKVDVNIAYCPERVLPGKILSELVSNSRILGGLTKACTIAAIELYRCFVEGELLPVDCRTAELCKLAENSYRDVNIAFANELSMVCDKLDVNVNQLISAANLHPRVNILSPGPGVGGHCIAVDPWFIVNSAPQVSLLIKTARHVNLSKVDWVVEQVFSLLAEEVDNYHPNSCKDIIVTFLGLAYKPDIDDLRESPAIEVVTRFKEKYSGLVFIVEPHINELPKELQIDGVQLHDLEPALQESNLVIKLVNHSEFKSAIVDDNVSMSFVN